MLSIVYLVCGMSYLVVYLELGIVSSVPFPSENYFAAMNIFYTNIDFAFQEWWEFFTWILHQEFIQIVKHFDSYPRSVTTQQYDAQHNTHYTTPYYTKLYYTTQHHTILHYTVFQHTTMHSQIPFPTCFYEQIGLGTWL